MKYMIAHLLEGEAKEFHRELSQRLSERFRLEWVGNRIDPHLTLKAPFTIPPEGTLADIEAILAGLANKETPQPFTVDGVDDFNGRSIHLSVQAPKQTHMLVRRLQDKLRQIPWLTFFRSEFPITLHATLCRPRQPQHAREIMAYLRKVRFSAFHESLDAFSLLALDEGRWSVRQRYLLRGDI